MDDDGDRLRKMKQKEAIERRQRLKPKSAAEQKAAAAAEAEAQKEAEKAGGTAAHKKTVRSTADPIKLDGQSWAVVSAVGPSDKHNHCDYVAIKISGVFATPEAATEHAKKLQEQNDDFDRWIVPLYEFRTMPPPAEAFESTRPTYTSKQPRLDQIMQGYHDRREKERAEFEERIRKVRRRLFDFSVTSLTRALCRPRRRPPKRLPSSAKSTSPPACCRARGATCRPSSTTRATSSSARPTTSTPRSAPRLLRPPPPSPRCPKASSPSERAVYKRLLSVECPNPLGPREVSSSRSTASTAAPSTAGTTTSCAIFSPARIVSTSAPLAFSISAFSSPRAHRPPLCGVIGVDDARSVEYAQAAKGRVARPAAQQPDGARRERDRDAERHERRRPAPHVDLLGRR